MSPWQGPTTTRPRVRSCKRVTFSTAKLELGARKGRLAKLRLSKAERALLRRSGRIRVLVTVKVTNAANERRTVEAVFDLRPGP